METSADAIARLKHANELLAADAQRANDELASARTLYQREVETRLTAERELDRYAREVHALNVEIVRLKDERDEAKHAAAMLEGAADQSHRDEIAARKEVTRLHTLLGCLYAETH